MPDLTPNWGRPSPTSSEAPNGPAQIKALADSLDDCPPITYDVAANRPVSTVGSPGKPNRFYFSTDTGVLERDTGTSWVPVDARIPSSTEKGYLDSISAFIATLLDDADAGTARATLGAAPASGIAIGSLADPTTGKVIGSSGSAAAAVFPPGYEVGYDQITAPVNISDSVDTTVIAGSAHTFDGQAVMLEFFAPAVFFAESGRVTFSVYEGASLLVHFGSLQYSTVKFPVCLRWRFTPSAGAHTYTVKAAGISASAVVTAGNGTAIGADVPAFMRFTKA